MDTQIVPVDPKDKAEILDLMTYVIRTSVTQDASSCHSLAQSGRYALEAYERPACCRHDCGLRCKSLQFHARYN